MMDMNYNNLLSIENLQNAFNKARRKGTVGSDGVLGKKIIDRNGFVLNLREKILTDKYYPQAPVRLSKLNYDNIRTIHYEIVCFEDQVVQFAIRNVINDCCKKMFEKQKNVFRHYGELEQYVSTIVNEYADFNYYIVDLKDFFASINIDILYSDIMKYCNSKNIIKIVDKCLYSYNDKNSGLPLGHILSTFLPHVYMISIDDQLSNYYRFSDCFVFKFKGEHSGFIDKFIGIISEKKLSINEKKTRILFNPSLEELKQSVVGI